MMAWERCPYYMTHVLVSHWPQMNSTDSPKIRWYLALIFLLLISLDKPVKIQSSCWRFEKQWNTFDVTVINFVHVICFIWCHNQPHRQSKTSSRWKGTLSREEFGFFLEQSCHQPVRLSIRNVNSRNSKLHREAVSLKHQCLIKIAGMLRTTHSNVFLWMEIIVAFPLKFHLLPGRLPKSHCNNV